MAGVGEPRRGFKARGKRDALQFQSGSREGAAEVVLGIGVTAREAGTTQPQDGKDLGQRCAAGKQILGDPADGQSESRGSTRWAVSISEALSLAKPCWAWRILTQGAKLECWRPGF
jgi:hypothetical protein